MKTAIRALIFATVVCVTTLLPAAVHAQPSVPPGCELGVLPHGALSLICVPPAGWNGQLVVFAHGYVPAANPKLDFYHLSLPDGTPIPALVEGLGYAFATTTYRKNGLAILEGVEDLKELVRAFADTHSVPLRTHVAGVSEGGLVTALLAERSPDLFTSALAACAPIGSFQGQIDYIGDFRVLFDYFFPGVIPGTAISVPVEVMANWETKYVPRIVAALQAHPSEAAQLIRVSHAPTDPADPTTIGKTTLDLLWYSAFATNDAIQALGGNAYENRLRLYFGSANDLRLNLRVQRFGASRAARAAVRPYETSGQLSIPLVTLHTTADDVIPFVHELFYLAKADVFNRGKFIPLPLFRYGHCSFMANEVLIAFLAAVSQP